MVFSYSIQVGGTETANFSGLKIRESVDGMGLSGVSTAELTFTVPPSEYILYFLPAAAEVKILFTDSNGNKDQIDQTFYISNRSSRNKTVSFKCYDRMILTDQAFTPNENLFTNEKITAYDALSCIASICGFKDYGILDINDVPDIKIPREKTIGSCRNMLELISSAWCGYFRTSIDNKLIFVPFGTAYTHVLDTEYTFHSAIEENNTKIITQVIMSGDGQEFTSGVSSGALSTLRISSSLASQELASKILSRIQNYRYQSWECSKFIFKNIYHGDFMTPTIEITFEDGEKRVANYIEKTFTSYGVVMKCGANDFSENEIQYQGSYSRNISSRIQDGEKLGNNTMITRYQGIVHVAETKSTKVRTINSASNENDSTLMFGYSPATPEGVVEFDGAMLDSVFPALEINDDATELTADYGGTVKKYKLTWDGDTKLSMSEIKEENL